MKYEAIAPKGEDTAPIAAENGGDSNLPQE